MANIIQIADVNDHALDCFRSLKLSQAKSTQTFIAETRTVILNALDCKCVPICFLIEEKYISGRDADILSRFDDIPVYTAETEILSTLTGFVLTRGIIALMKRPAPKSFDEVVSGSQRLAVLSKIQDASNVGTILRSAAALGMDGALLDEECCDPFHRKAIRTSTGGVFRLPWAQVRMSGRNIAAELRSKGFVTAALALNKNALSVGSEKIIDRKRPLALFLGSEGDGLDQDTISACDHSLLIPMKNHSDSLNVASAASIAFYEYSIS